MAIGKKAIFFSFTAILMISVFMASLDTQDYVTLVNKVPTIEGRVQVSNDFVKDLNENYIKQFISTVGYSSMNHYLSDLNSRTNFDTKEDMEKIYGSLFMEGKFPSAPSRVMETNFPELINNVSKAALDVLDLGTTFSIGEMHLIQSDKTGPWEVGTIVEINYTVDASVAVWFVSKNITGTYSIIGLNDSFYVLNTKNSGNTVYKKIKPTLFDTWPHLDNFTEMVLYNGGYVHTNSSPSYLSRLINSSTPSDCCGIHSFINESTGYYKSDGTLDAGEYRNVSFVDVCYFLGDMEDSDIDCGDLWMVKPLSTDSVNPSDYLYPFRIDTYHAAYYNLSTMLGVGELIRP